MGFIHICGVIPGASVSRKGRGRVTTKMMPVMIRVGNTEKLY